jgi:uncharacterized membrane protein HdeD (DUF308 family)
MAETFTGSLSSLRKLIPSQWWVVLLRGIIAVLFGPLAFARPYVALELFITVVAIFALIDGIVILIAAFRGRATNSKWWVVLLRGLLVIGIGLVALLFTLPLAGVTLTLSAIVLGIGFLIAGGIDIITAIRVRKQIDNEWSIIISGVFAILLGLMIASAPLLLTTAFIIFLGGFITVYGILEIIAAFRLRRQARQQAE